MRAISRREFVGWSLAGSASLALAACGIATSSTSGKKTSLSVGMKATLTSLSPIAIAGYQWYQMVGHALYDALVRKDSQGKNQPHMAVSWDDSSPTVTIIKVRQGVHFKTGDPVTAKDVAYSIAVRCDPALVAQTSSRPVMTPKQWVSAEVVDAYTVRINTTERVSILTQRQPILVVPENAFTRYNLSNADVGSGPFQLTSFISGSSLQERPIPTTGAEHPSSKRLGSSFSAM